MKKLTLLLSLVLILLLGLAVYFYVGGTLSARPTVHTASAADYPEAFASIQNVIAASSAPQLFSSESLADASAYSLVDINLSLVNRGIFDAEWLNIQLSGVHGDIAVYSLTGDGADVPARSGAQVNLKLITRAPADARREISIQYYVYGISRTITVEV